MEESNMDTVTTTTVEIAGPNGHDALELTQSQTMAVVEAGDNWIFASGQMMQPSQLAEADWETVGTVRIVPGLVGGLY
jgi:precorrin-3B methylase|tara:strand:+ start:411 stop:644 length:234 start_codon:yes stop_codon:yes gene_type:complete